MQSKPQSGSTATTVEDPPPGWGFTISEFREPALDRHAFLKQPRAPITVVLDRVKGAHNIGTIFRLADGFLVDRVVICGPKIDIRKRKLVKAAAGTQNWVPGERAKSAAEVVADLKAAGAWVVVAHQNCCSSLIDALTPALPACLVLGSDRNGVSQEVLDLADAVVRVPMLGMARSLNVNATAAILLHWLSGARQESMGASLIQARVHAVHLGTRPNVINPSISKYTFTRRI
jgi:tRNA G18 (ribose-2'-O)-methylase SpoU